ncbi:unnamed protein product [Lymnaea stagnalis]|uniref:Transporter n=1 Tax=Lymnaea stagnalis TaxID=6523 RepID=A0AAV2IGQ2_LYMST
MMLTQLKKCDSTPVDLVVRRTIMPSPDKSIELSLDESEISPPAYDERETWGKGLDYFLSCIGFAVGLGNIWRFPYLCYKSGGGAFLVPYVSFLLLCGFPLFYLETAYGQFASLSPITVWRLSPIFTGIGYGMVTICAVVCIYYNIIIAWTFYYLFMSFKRVLPWTTCGNPWNTPLCVAGIQDKYRQGNATNFTGVSGQPVKTFVTASQEFWKHNLLEQSDGIEHIGTVRLPLLGCLCLAWLIVFLCLSKGIKSSGKVVYVTALFPYVVLVILLGRGLTLEGARQGIEFYLIPKWGRLQEFNVWGDAAVQIFYSVGMAWGSLITMSSYNKFNHKVYRDAMLVPLINCGTSVFAGFVIFSVLGFMAHTTNLPIDKVVSQGPGLIFVAYPEAISRLPVPHVWSVMFFMMIFTVGIDSQFGMFETMTSAFIDEYPRTLRMHKTSFTAFVCLVEFLLGIPMVCQGGIYILQIIDWYSSSFSLMILSFFECMVISWVYGVNRFYKDIELMLGRKPFFFWKIMWAFITPVIILFTLIASISQMGPVKLDDYHYPVWAVIIGWTTGVVSLVPMPLCAFIKIKRETTGTIWQKIKKLSQPAHNWGPSRIQDRNRYYASMNDYEIERHEAAMLSMDRGRYLAIIQQQGQGSALSSPTGAMSSPTGAMSSPTGVRFSPAGAISSPTGVRFSSKDDMKGERPMSGSLHNMAGSLSNIVGSENTLVTPRLESGASASARSSPQIPIIGT